MRALRRPVRQLIVFWHASWPLTLALVAVVLTGPFVSVAAMTLSGRLVAQVLGGEPVAALLLTTAFLAACLVGLALLDALRQIAQSAARERVSAAVQALVVDTALAPHGIAHLEAGEPARALRGVADDVHSLFGTYAVPGTWEVYRSRVLGIGAFVLVARWDVWVALLVGAAYIGVAQSFNRYIQTLTATIFGEAAGDKARELMFRDLTTSRSAAKEVRLFGLTGWALGRSDTLWSRFAAGEWPRRNALLRKALPWQVLLLLVHVVALWVLGAQVWARRLDPGEALVVLTAVAGLSAWGNLGDWQTHAVRQQTELEQLDDLRRGLGLPGVTAKATPAALTRPRDRRAAGVRLHGVSFTYPSRSTPVFTGLDLTVPAGQSCAVVGVNGAGKSTLIKLLTGMYPPDAGTVRIDDADPGVDDEARRRVAVIFQEFTRYPADLVDNVALGLPGTRSERAELATVALERAGAAAVLDRVGSLDTPLSAELKGGTDLSGGQWQRVALARALLAVEAGAGVLVLDEPTAALDVRAEAALFDRFLEVTRGVTTLLVSHRLSSVRHADRIVVVDDGRIVEDGSHDELIAAGGRYAEAFGLQASRFAAAGGDPDQEQHDA